MTTEGRDRDRDRDAAGRPRNARPRDDTGRPLSRGSAQATQEDPPALPPTEALAQADELLRTGRAFRAHEVLEAVWKTQQTERDLWRALAQLAVGITHAQRGNPTGSRALLTRAAANLQPWAGTTPYGIAIDHIREWATAAAADPEKATEPPRLSG